MTWYMEGITARPRVIRGTRTAPLPLLPSGPGGVCSRPLHGARDLTSLYRSTAAFVVFHDQAMRVRDLTGQSFLILVEGESEGPNQLCLDLEKNQLGKKRSSPPSSWL